MNLRTPIARGLSGFHRHANAAQHELRGGLSDPQQPVQLVRADPLFGVGHHPDGNQTRSRLIGESSKIVPGLG